MISPLSAHVTLRGIKAQVTRELSARCSPRFRVAVFGDSWVVTGATGRQTVCASIEDAALAVVSGAGVVTQGSWAVSMEDSHGQSPRILRIPDPSILTPAELVDCLLWFAANEPAALHPA
ncbi:hypothetical protein [Lysinibacter cavernae]|uniref:Uncharacterized protein n=1 Tax=Lysinibacter cavernae TaxID=1640652 RepID=A0A7X5R356_9MICO|nr:hypothetical protein [Lysinibacter cavernae]NIH54813.1 hypothetical protein [Lysinibacter cavernae]